VEECAHFKQKSPENPGFSALAIASTD